MSDEAAPDTVQQVDKSGNPVARRMKSARTAYRNYERLKENDRPAAHQRRRVKGLIDGNAPYSEDKLKRRGLGWLSNVNFREGESIIDNNTGAYWELSQVVDQLVRVKLHVKTKDDDGMIRDHEEVIAEEFTNLMMDWPQFPLLLMLMIKEMLITGVAVPYFKDAFDWRFSLAQSGQVLVPVKTKTYEPPKYVYIRGELDLEYLFDIIDMNDRSNGWNLEQIKKAIVKQFDKGENNNRDEKYQLSRFEDIQQRVKNRDWDDDETDMEELRVVHLFVVETSGKVTHSIFQDDDESSEYLYDMPNKFDMMDSLVNLFFYDMGDGWYKSVRGLGQRIFPHIQLSNRNLNHTINSSTIASSLILKGTTQSGRGKMNVVRVGPLVSLPQGYDAIQSSFTPQLGPLVSVRTMMNNILDNNTGAFRRVRESPGEQPTSATGERIRDQRETRLQNTQIALFYVQLDRLYAQIMKRLLAAGRDEYPEMWTGYEHAKKFVDRCIDRGVPKKFLNCDTIKLRATRAIGMGSPTQRQFMTGEILSMAGSFDQVGQNNILRDTVAARTGSYAEVDRYVKRVNRDQIPTNETSFIALENNDMREGGHVPVGIDQTHKNHFVGHAAPLAEQMPQIEKQMDQIQDIAPFFIYFDMATRHMAAHLQLMSSDKIQASTVKQFEKLLDQLNQFTEQLARALEKQRKREMKQLEQKQQQIIEMQQQAQKTEANADVIRALAKIQMDATELQNKMANQNIKTAQQMRLKEAKAVQDMSIKARRAAMEDTNE